MTTVAKQIELACVQFILSANVENLTGANLFVRDKPIVLQKDPPYVCVLVIGEEWENQRQPRTNTTVRYDYPVLVVYGRRTALSAPNADVWLKNARAGVRDQLRRHLLLGADGPVRRCSYNPTPRFSITGHDEGWKYTGQMFIYTTEENRVA